MDKYKEKRQDEEIDKDEDKNKDNINLIDKINLILNKSNIKYVVNLVNWATKKK